MGGVTLNSHEMLVLGCWTGRSQCTPSHGIQLDSHGGLIWCCDAPQPTPIHQVTIWKSRVRYGVSAYNQKNVSMERGAWGSNARYYRALICWDDDRELCRRKKAREVIGKVPNHKGQWKWYRKLWSQGSEPKVYMGLIIKGPPIPRVLPPFSWLNHMLLVEGAASHCVMALPTNPSRTVI